MNRARLFRLAEVVVGAVFVFLAVPDVTAGNAGLPVWLSALGGAGLVAAAGYYLVRPSADTFEPDRGLLWVVVGGAIAALCGLMLSIA